MKNKINRYDPLYYDSTGKAVLQGMVATEDGLFVTHEEYLRATDTIDYLLAQMKQISNWNERDNADLEICRMQWRGCVAIANHVLNKYKNEK